MCYALASSHEPPIVLIASIPSHHTHHTDMVSPLTSGRWGGVCPQQIVGEDLYKDMVCYFQLGLCTARRAVPAGRARYSVQRQCEFLKRLPSAPRITASASPRPNGGTLLVIS
jgi:hypothetical protein